MDIKQDRYLVVPVSLDALCVPRAGCPALEAMADFSKLPYLKPGRDGASLLPVNPGTPFTSETVLSQPFNDSNVLLEPGIHLHWSLPDALTRAVQRTDADGKLLIEFPAVPNRWFIVRYRDDAPQYFWMVKSDYLWPEHFDYDQADLSGDVERPRVTWRHQTPWEAGQAPFRYLGQVLGWSPDLFLNDVFPGDRVDKLTAVGFGHPMFAAFYPNCRGVFGFNDNISWEGQDMTRFQYEVFGWYTDAEEDPLHTFVLQYAPDRYAGKNVLEAMEEAFEWSLPENERPFMPGKILCYARHRFTQAVPPSKPAALNPPLPDIAVGNTGTEALSAYLAGKMSADENERARIENQLESLHLQSTLQQQGVDLGPVFEEARHSKSFSPVSGGRLWTLRPESAAAAGQDKLNNLYRDPESSRYFLPPDFEEQLHDVNRLQKHFNKATAGIASLRQQIFTDWHKYMVCCYHDEAGVYPDIDQVRLHIEDLMDLLDLHLAYTGKIDFDPESGWTAAPDPEQSHLRLLQDYDRLEPRLQRDFIRWLTTYQDGGAVPASLAQRMASRLNGMALALGRRNAVLQTIRTIHDGLKDETRTWTVSETQQALAPLQQQLNALAQQSELPKLDALNIPGPASGEPLPGDLKKGLLSALTPLAALPVLHLEAVPAPRFWQPNEPVLLLAGAAAQTTDRHGMDGQGDPDGLHRCFVFDAELSTALLNIGDGDMLERLMQHPASFRDPLQNPESAGSGDGNPWNLLGFEWEVSVSPLSEQNNLKPGSLQFSADFITRNYALTETRSEFLTTRANRAVEQSASYFNGRSILTPYAEEQLAQSIGIFLAGQLRQYLLSVEENGGSLTGAEKNLLVLPAGRGMSDLAPWLNWYEDAGNTSAILQYFDEQYRADLLKTYWNTPLPATDESTWSAAEKTRARHISLPLPGTQTLLTAFFETNRADILAWFDERSASATRTDGPLHTILAARDELKQWKEHGHFIQTQSLDGFNAALLMHRKTWQMEIAEPGAFPEYAAFSERVARAVGNENLALGLPQLDFHPLRTGEMTLNRLRLMDTFGRSQVVIDQTTAAPLPEVFVPERMKGSRSGNINLPARIIQPARLHFRWLIADNPDRETSAHPDTGPICGWVVPNYIDDSLMIYDANGVTAGYFDANGAWRMAPGSALPLSPYDIVNPALRKMVLWISGQVKKTPGFIVTFGDMLEETLERIDPEDAAQHNARSLLMGRPIALVQASLDFDLKGWPAVHQDWVFFDRVIKGENYQTDNFTGVEVPIRIGEHQRLNDGVVGFWCDTEEGYRDDLFYSPLRQLTFTQSIGAPAQRLTVLLVPQGKLHCTTGILPTKALNIPEEFYTGALQRIQVGFLTAPVLSDPGRITLTLPDEPGFDWAWLQRNENAWLELNRTPRVFRSDVLRAFEDGADVWARLVAAGWIESVPPKFESALIAAKEARRAPELYLESDTQDEKQRWINRKSDVEAALDMLLRAIVEPAPDLCFGPVQEIREGWLVLKPA